MRYLSPWIFTTNKCNLRCPYCYVDFDDNKMSKEVYDRINTVFLGMLERDEVDLVIYRLAGGEPLLVFDEWKGFVEDFLTKHEGTYVSIITNLTQLTDEMIEFFKKFKDKIRFDVSLDGYVHSKPSIYGSSTARLVRSNIDRLLANGFKSIGITTVIDPYSFDEADFLANWIGPKHIAWGINLNHFFAGEIDKDFICKKMKQVINVLKTYNYDIIRLLSFNNVRLNYKYEGCTAGEKLLAIDVNGGIYPCQTLVGGKPVCNIFSCEDIIQAFKEQNMYKVGYNYILPERCKECPLSKICGGGCKLHNKGEFTCDIMKSVIYDMLLASDIQ